MSLKLCLSAHLKISSFPGIYTNLADQSIWSFVHKVIEAKDTIDLNGLEGHVCPSL